MANLSVFNMEGKEVGTIEVSDAVFGVEVNEHLVHMAVVQQAAEENPGDRRVPVMQDRDPRGLPSGPEAALYSHPFREIIPSSSTGKRRGRR